jgi:hypothetical protein
MAARPNFWFWPIPAAATVERPGPWKTELQDRVGNPFGLAVTLAHYPTGAAKWNPIEHRAAGPLDSYDKMLKSIRTTSTRTGLVVTAYLDRNEYPTGLKPNAQLISSLSLKPGKICPDGTIRLRPICEVNLAPALSGKASRSGGTHCIHGLAVIEEPKSPRRVSSEPEDERLPGWLQCRRRWRVRQERGRSGYRRSSLARAKLGGRAHCLRPTYTTDNAVES